MTEQQQRPTTAQRMKWNDIRRVGPLLVIALIAIVATFGTTNPADAVSDSLGASCDVEAFAIEFAEGDACSPCYSVAVVAVGAADVVGATGDCPEIVKVDPCIAAGGYRDGDRCCAGSAAVTGVVLANCEPVETPEVEEDDADGETETPPPPPERVRTPPPAPDAIMGPIWLGAIQVDVLAPGLVELDFPDLLDAFIGGNVIKVYDADGVLVYEDGLPRNGKMLVFSSNAPMTVKTTLTTLAPYTEIVAPVSSAN